jgi:hypothetical protein
MEIYGSNISDRTYINILNAILTGYVFQSFQPGLDLISNGYTQISNQNALAGVFLTPPATYSDLSEWIYEATYQHHCSYPNLLDVPNLLLVFPFVAPPA